jgi:two-component system KDP operon response regulator KdpE
MATAAAFRPDVIVLDLGLPDLDGVEVIRRLREWSRQPIVVLSVRDREDDKVEALAHHLADDLLDLGAGDLPGCRRRCHAFPLWKVLIVSG